MSQPIEIGPVIEFGAEPPPAKRGRRRFDLGGWARELAGDRRVVPLTAILGGIALFGSLSSEWQVTRLDTSIEGDGHAGVKSIAVSIADLGAWGGGYLVGLFLLVTATVLVLFGPGPGRPYARLAGLSVGGVLAGLLAALSSELADSSRVLGPIFQSSLTADQFQISYGRGLWCAVFGVAAVLVSLVLAGRHDGPVLSWRRPVREDDQPAPDEPYDLTVSQAVPFQAGDRDKPN